LCNQDASRNCLVGVIVNQRDFSSIQLSCAV
jgi:hypothetical protein